MVQWLRICDPFGNIWLCWVFTAVCGLLVVMCGLSSSSVGAPLMVHRLSFPVACRSYADSLACMRGYSVAKLCPPLCDPIHCSLPGSSVHGILQARILEWVAISFSKESSQSRD